MHKDTDAKKKSPLTLRRNAKRREEFLKKKQTNPSGRIPLEDDAPVSASDRPQCDQCEYKASSEKVLRQHVRMKHKEQACATPENLNRQGDLSRSLTSSPLLNGREEKCQNCEGLFSHTSYLSILVHRRIIEVYKKYTKKLSELATK